ncbi:hypothetical protein ACIO13_22215 [Streptomyces sp. NPDC087425]|uniref:hypothetical protein n=1 Tax=Streptomyces sp. NPDC087425 TaxID=3365787 RepID=UPI003817ECBB
MGGRGQWLLRHPAVCSLSHEELTGPASARDQALARLLDALGHPGPPPLPAPRPADDDPTGVAPGRGRDLFSDAHEQLLHRHHSDLTSFQYR